MCPFMRRDSKDVKKKLGCESLLVHGPVILAKG